MDLQDNLGLSYLFITHDLSVVKHISDDIAVMYLGKCIEKAPSQQLFQDPKHPYTKALLSSIPEPDISMRHRKIETISGEITSPINPKPGCRFAVRCPQAKEACFNTDPTFADLGDKHFCACHLVTE